MKVSRPSWARVLAQNLPKAADTTDRATDTPHLATDAPDRATDTTEHPTDTPDVGADRLADRADPGFGVTGGAGRPAGCPHEALDTPMKTLAIDTQESCDRT